VTLLFGPDAMVAVGCCCVEEGASMQEYFS